MKRMMIMGGFLGFGLGMALGLMQGSTWSVIFWRASVAACLAGLLMRWWGRVWLHNLEAAYLDQAAAAASSATPSSTTPNKS